MLEATDLGYSRQHLLQLTSALRARNPQACVAALQSLLGPLEAVLLHGSRARGQQHASSDYDLVVVLADPGSHREGLRWRFDGLDLDIDVVGPGFWKEPRTYLRGGLIWWDQGGRLKDFMERLEGLCRRGPGPLSPAQRLRMAAWLDRMLARGAQEDDLVARFRQAQLLNSLLEVALRLCNQFPQSYRPALAWLETGWPEFSRALRGGGLEEAAALCRRRLLDSDDSSGKERIGGGGR